MKAKVRKIIIGVLGGTVLVSGVLMIALPGPAILVIPAGLAILATEFEWAHNLNVRLQARVKAMREKRQAKQKTTHIVPIEPV